MPAAITITTFGYLHGRAPQAHLTVDLRTHFRDPHLDPALRELDARDIRVRVAVMGTPGIVGVTDSTVDAIRAYLSGPSAGPVSVAVGCAGGRHRAATVGMAIARMLRDVGHPAELVHRDIDKPVAQRGIFLVPPRSARRRRADRVTIWHVRLAVAALLITTAAAIWIAAH